MDKGIRVKIQIFLSLLLFFVFGGEILAKTYTNKDIDRIKDKGSSSAPDYSKQPDIPDTPVTKGAGSKHGALVVKKFLPYKEWEDEYKEYFKLHYNDDSLKLQPSMIVLHYSGVPNFSKLWWTFVKGGNYSAGDHGKKFGHLSTHFVIDKDGSIYQLMPLERRSRGTYGVNHKAISIDIIGRNEKELLGNKTQMKVTFALVKWIMKKYRIPTSSVRAHTEVARGKELVPEYTDFADSKNPDAYPPDSNPRGPGKSYMFKLRYYLHEPR